MRREWIVPGIWDLEEDDSSTGSPDPGPRQRSEEVDHSRLIEEDEVVNSRGPFGVPNRSHNSILLVKFRTRSGNRSTP